MRREVEAALPSYRFVETTGGSGPIVTFERPAKKYPKLRERIALQKGLHGANWFRVNLCPSFVGPGAGGAEIEHILCSESLGADVRWKSDAELEAALTRTSASLERAAAKFFGRFEEAYDGYATLFGGLVRTYVSWLASEGNELAARDFILDDDGKLPAFDAWKRALAKKKLFERLPGDLETSLWRFWHGGRPMRREDYTKGDYYDCSVCNDFISFARGRLVAREDPVAFEHWAFVCKKH